jgi:hypothetical protein
VRASPPARWTVQAPSKAPAIGGSIIAGLDNSATGTLTRNASILANDDIGSLTVKGSLVGSVGGSGDITKVILSARGQAAPTASTDLAFGKIKIGGRVERAQIFAGYNTGLNPLNGNAQIGSVKVGGDWIASDLVAGVKDGGTPGFGDAGDTIINPPPNPVDSIAKIARIVIGGIVEGTAAGGDQFGFESHAIGSFKMNGFTIPILSPVSLSPITGNDVTIRLV